MKEWVYCLKWSGNQSGEHRSAGPNSRKGERWVTLLWIGHPKGAKSKRSKRLVEQDWSVWVYGPWRKCMPVQTTQRMYVEQLVLIFVCCFRLCSFVVGPWHTSYFPTSTLSGHTSHHHGQPIAGSRFLTSCKFALFLTPLSKENYCLGSLDHWLFFLFFFNYLILQNWKKNGEHEFSQLFINKN
jgi:hypothetical protein